MIKIVTCKLFLADQNDYVDLLVLPKGARNITIKELSKASHFLGMNKLKVITNIMYISLIILVIWWFINSKPSRIRDMAFISWMADGRMVHLVSL